MRWNYRDALGEAFAVIGEEFKDLAVVTADVSKSTRSIKFKERYPERFFSVGIAEANAVGISAGISTFGGPVIFTAYSVFATEKPFEQIRNMLCYPKLNVKIVATHGGINVGEDGVTHQAIEDVAIMRAIPNMKVVVVADPGEVLAALRAVVKMPGPVFLRLARAETEVLHEDANLVNFEIGKAEVMREGTDVTLIGMGMMVWESIKAAKLLEKEGISARVINIRTVKPIDVEEIVKAANETGCIVTAEDHNCYGGLGSAVAEVLAKHAPVPMEQVALMDTFAESGECDLLLEKYGLTDKKIVERALLAIQRKK
ncbi:MAG: transketolase [Firmicutes bacterium HGW-Firmicutes-7]|nr:MAG: transketolase [Firmicutes bacterium HGW-Firmicutes-7]